MTKSLSRRIWISSLHPFSHRYNLQSIDVPHKKRSRKGLRIQKFLFFKFSFYFSHFLFFSFSPVIFHFHSIAFFFLIDAFKGMKSVEYKFSVIVEDFMNDSKYLSIEKLKFSSSNSCQIHFDVKIRQFTSHIWEFSVFHMKNAKFLKIYYEQLVLQVDIFEVEDNSSKNNSRVKKLFVTCCSHEGWQVDGCCCFCVQNILVSLVCCFFRFFALVLPTWALVTLSVSVSMTTKPRNTNQEK